MSTLQKPDGFVEIYPGCPCHACDSPTWVWHGGCLVTRRLSMCPRCGSKRCDGAVDHHRPCTTTRRHEPVTR